MIKKMWMFVLVGLLLTLTAGTYAGDDEEHEEKITLNQAPKVVRKIIRQEAKGGEIREIERITEDDEIVYEAEIIKDGREIDFLATKGEKPSLMLEVKWDDAERSPNFSVFDKYLAGTKKIQVVKELKREKTYPDGLEIRLARNWLSEMRLEE